ncbi:MAG: TMEM165/GDT1 family protein [Promethearchaeota archaeon]
MDSIILLTTFGILFLGELGDKTQLIVFNLTLEHKKSYKVGIGATLGFAVIVTLGVFFGTIITNVVPITVIAIISGIIFILIGILEVLKIRKLYLEKHKSKFGDNGAENIESENDDLQKVTFSKLSRIKKNAYLAGFLFIFIMELGDKTQILTITLTSIYSSPLEVWIGSFLALISLAWMGVTFGALIVKKVPKLYIKLVSAIIFIIIGIITLISSI